MSGEVSLEQVKADIEVLIKGHLYHAGDLNPWDENACKERAARVRAFLTQCEAGQTDPLRMATPEALIAELRSLLAAMKPGSRLDVFDGILAGYCVQCGDVMDDVCPCDGEEYHAMNDPAFDKNNPAY